MMIATYEPKRPGTHLNVREAPNPIAKVVGAIEAGSVPCEAVERGWCKVDGGYADARFLTVSCGEAGDTAERAEQAPTSDGGAAAAHDGDEEGRSNLMRLTNRKLRDLASQSGIKVPKDAKKAELVEAILTGADE